MRLSSATCRMVRLLTLTSVTSLWDTTSLTLVSQDTTWINMLSSSYHTYQKGPEGKGIELKEAGPRFQLRCKKLKLHNNFILLNLFNFDISLLQCTIWSWGRLITLMLPILNGHTDPTWILRRREDFSPMTMAGKHKYVNQLIKGLIWIKK